MSRWPGPAAVSLTFQFVEQALRKKVDDVAAAAAPDCVLFRDASLGTIKPITRGKFDFNKLTRHDHFLRRQFENIPSGESG